MFRMIFNSIKLRRLNKLLAELCDNNSCRNCASYLGNSKNTSKPLCAQWHVIEQALEKWGLNKKECFDD